MPLRSGTLGPIDLRRAFPRVSVAAAIALAAGALVHLCGAPHVFTYLVGGDAGALALILLAWSNIGFADAAETRLRAAAEDPGRRAVYVLILLSSVASLLIANVLVRGAKTAPPLEAVLLVLLCLVSVAVAWTLTHTAFALRYAHLYYRDDEDGTGGIDFPGGQPPDYFDFTYFAFTIGMCFQVSDTTVSSRIIRRAVLFQAAIAFFYNTAILAFVLNLAFSLA